MSGSPPFQPDIKVPFVKPAVVGAELQAIAAVVAGRLLAGDNRATRSAEAKLRRQIGAPHALLTPSGTAALELSAILADLGPGDEVVMPSYTFSSTANAVVLRGAIPVFVDIRPDTLNIDEALIEAALTERTRAIMVVHYAGLPCAMDPIKALARDRGLLVIEDAAQALGSFYRDQAAGALGDMAAFSFHETKNVHSGEGGAFVCQDAAVAKRAEIVREKGTNRAAFFRGEIDKYTWIDLGSSFLPNELGAAFLDAQLDSIDTITARRLEIWARYDEALGNGLAGQGVLTPHTPDDCRHNAHIYHLRLPSLEVRTRFLQLLRSDGVQATSHYVPLHSSPAGKRYGRPSGPMTHTDAAGAGLLRVPLWPEMSDADVDYVISVVAGALKATAGR